MLQREGQQVIAECLTELTRYSSRETKNRKKRLRRKEEWLCNKAKKARNLGQAYTSQAKERKEIPARSILPPCSEKCKLKCTQKINAEARENKFNSYWKLGDVTLQRNFIHKCIQPIIPKYRYSVKEIPRRVNHAFYFTIRGEKIRVCKHFYISTLGISDRVVRTVIKKSEDGFLHQDLRGKHSHQRTKGKISYQLGTDDGKQLQNTV